MKIVANQERGFLVVRVEGRLDIATSPEFEKSGAAFMEEGHKKIILDFSSLEYISSAGLRSILSIAKEAEGRRRQPFPVRTYRAGERSFRPFRLRQFPADTRGT